MFKPKSSLAICATVVTLCASSQIQPLPVNNPWQSPGQTAQNRSQARIWIRPDRFFSVVLDHDVLRNILDRAPKESGQPVAASPAEIMLPMPDGSLARFRIVESPVMAPELAAKFPEIKTYSGRGIDDPQASLRFDVTPPGFHAQILSPNGAVYIDPLFRGDTNDYASYYKHDYHRATDDFVCRSSGGEMASLIAGAAAVPAMANSGSLRTYRLACAATAEYTEFQGGTVAAGMAAIVTAINRVTGVYESEVAIRLSLVANDDLIVYTNVNTEPYSNDDGDAMLSQNQATLDSVIGSANYDIGHVFSTGGGGVSYIGVVCVTGYKAGGVTGSSDPTGDSFWIDYVAHEMGHEFGAYHPFNSTNDDCGDGNRNASTAYEPGSGSTIMAYAGICGTDDLQPHSDPYFHSVNLDEIITYTTTGSGSSCPVTTSTGNSTPTVNAGANYTIPSGTPFTLTATGSDPNSGALTYCWEERDLGPSTTLTAPDNGSSPLFRSFKPVSSPSRTFPQISDILDNTTTLGEMLPTTSRTMTFRVTARDNLSDGGDVNSSEMQLTVVSNAGPFAITSPNTKATLSGLQTVTWNVAGTTASPISAATVNILLSTNGGQTFPIMLAANAPNNGTNIVTLPNINTSTARIMVEAASNIFFNISRTNFSIVPGSSVPLVVAASAGLQSESCTPTNGAVDPGETVTVKFALKNTGAANTTNLVATLLDTNGVTLPGGPQTYGVLTAGGSAVTQAFSFTAMGACGSNITAVLQLQDGAASLGMVSFVMPLGATTLVFTQYFDGVTAPALPSGWTTSSGGAQSNWVTSTSAYDTAPNSAFSPDPGAPGSNTLVSPSIVLPAGSAQLSFRNNYNLESGYDGGVLEIKIGSGAFTDIVAAGGSFISGGYTAAISGTYGNPLAGRQAWTGNSGGFITTTVDLPASAAGQTIQLRWICGTDDGGTTGTGWYIDTVVVITYACCADGPSITVQPEGELVPVGSNATFNVSASGTAPLYYQWLFNGTNLAGANATNLTEFNVQLTNAGNYSVVVTNVAGSTNSASATLAVVAWPELADALPGTNSDFKFLLSGTAGYNYQIQSSTNLMGTNWTVVTTVSNATGQVAVDITNVPGVLRRFFRVRLIP
jgi:hypothetical protein